VAIRNGDELAGLLRKAHEIESSFESVVQWEGYVNVADSEMRAVLFELISDSNEHRRIVESLLAMVRTGGDAGSLPLQPKTFNFKGRNDAEVMNEIAKVEKLMFDMYSDILSAVDVSDLKSLLSDVEDAESFVSHLNTLIEGEAKHMAIVARYVRKVDRLR
jgi:rubrerythrin